VAVGARSGASLREERAALDLVEKVLTDLPSPSWLSLSDSAVSGSLIDSGGMEMLQK
jgi:hypothetical protein